MKFDLSKVKLSDNDIKRGLVLPKSPSENLAEFIGILAGDGHVSFNTKKYKILIIGNYFTDYDYFYNHTKTLIKNLFNINPKIIKKKNQNSLVLYFNSKGCVSYMENMGYYKKLIKIIIPNWIKLNETYFLSFIRGLFDTDGSIFVSDKKGAPNYPCIELTTICYDLANIVKNLLLKKNFKVPKIRSYYYSHSKNASLKVSLYGYSNLSKWLNEIGFSNEYKLNRALEYQKIRSGTDGI